MAFEKKSRHRRSGARYVVYVACLSALLTVSKLALSFVPNVELVTALIVCYGSALGLAYAFPASVCFCLVEMAIYGVGSWNILYFVYWPLLAAISSLTLKGNRLWLALIIGAVGSVLFGVLSACADTIVVAANLAGNMLGKYFTAYYIRGLYFDIVHTASSILTIALLYLPVVAALKRALPRACFIHISRARGLTDMSYVYVREEQAL